MKVPQEYLDFLSAGKNIDITKLANEYEPEFLKSDLIPADHLKVETVRVHTECLQADMFIDWKEEGYFTIRYIPLIDFSGTFVYYPDLECYGQAGSSDHCYFFVLNEKSLDEIAADSYQFLIGYFEWDEGAEYMMSTSDLGKLPFKAGPSDDGWFIREGEEE